MASTPPEYLQHNFTPPEAVSRGKLTFLMSMLQIDEDNEDEFPEDDLAVDIEDELPLGESIPRPKGYIPEGFYTLPCELRQKILYMTYEVPRTIDNDFNFSGYDYVLSWGFG